MSRSAKVREEAYRLDDYHCQVCGLDARNYPDRITISPHHNERLGMGGSDERDTVENVITLCVGPNSCHDRETRGLLKIENFSREKGTMEVYVRNSVQEEWRRLPDEEVWFHRKRRKDQAEQALERLQTIMKADTLFARDMWLLSQGYKEIDPTARSFTEFVSSYGWRPNAAEAAAAAWKYVQENHLNWPEGVNYRKVELIARANPPDAQEWLNRAADMSYSDLETELVRKGAPVGHVRWFMVFPRALIPHIYFVRSRDKEAVLERVRKADGNHFSSVVVEARAFRHGLHWRRGKHSGLVDVSGREVPHERW